MNKPALSLICTLMLAACAGGGVGEPKTPTDVPKLAAFSDASKLKPHADNAKLATLSTANNGSKVSFQGYKRPHPAFGWEIELPVYFYQTKDGKQYELGGFTTPLIPASGTPSWAFKTKHEGQQTADGGRVLVCCTSEGQWTSAPATKLSDNLRYGAWVGADGAVDLFVSGVPVVVDFGQRDEAGEPKVKGKATYEVWAIRAGKDGFSTSSYTPHYKDNPGAKGKTVRSLITANFNTNKLKGTLRGNADFGADIELNDVDLVGNGFRGTAVSDQQQGTVDGKFYGNFDGYWKSNSQIGGVVVFENKASLNAAFGGTLIERNKDTKSTDLEHLVSDDADNKAAQ